MTYDIKSVFYLDTQVTLPAGGAAGDMASVQLNISSYIDPIARGRSKGTGLAIYKVHYDLSTTSPGYRPNGDTLDGMVRLGLLAGVGLGNQQAFTGYGGNSEAATADNPLLVWGADYYAPESLVSNATVTNYNRVFCEPSEKVPYVAVRDNICLTGVYGAIPMSSATYCAVRLECAQITLDQATLNQLLRTQTV